MTNIKTMMEELAQEELERDVAACREVMKMQKDKYGFESMPTIEDLGNYESPIQVVCREMQNTFDNDVLKAVLSYGISVDKDELIRALQYDRDQYRKGFADGVHVNLGEDVVRVVRCKDCKHWKPTGSELGTCFEDMEPIGGCRYVNFCRKASDFCSYGERRSDT